MSCFTFNSHPFYFPLSPSCFHHLGGSALPPNPGEGTAPTLGQAEQPLLPGRACVPFLTPSLSGLGPFLKVPQGQKRGGGGGGGGLGSQRAQLSTHPLRAGTRRRQTLPLTTGQTFAWHTPILVALSGKRYLCLSPGPPNQAPQDKRA